MKDTDHLFCDCHAWDSIRTGFHALDAATARSWPPCLRNCGLSPADILPTPEARRELALALQSMHARILLARQQKEGHLPTRAPGEEPSQQPPAPPRSLPVPPAPWLWTPTGPTRTFAHPLPLPLRSAA